MLTEHSGTLFDSTAPVLGHGINCHGKMGAGIAVAFRQLYPDMYTVYAQRCSRGFIRPGDVFWWTAPKRIIANIASQDAPGPDARYDWLFDGVKKTLLNMAAIKRLDRLAIPQIGCGIGGLRYEIVKPLLQSLSATSGVDIEVWSL